MVPFSAIITGEGVEILNMSQNGKANHVKMLGCLIKGETNLNTMSAEGKIT
jgi:hypothetical protein